MHFTNIAHISTISCSIRTNCVGRWIFTQISILNLTEGAVQLGGGGKHRENAHKRKTFVFLKAKLGLQHRKRRCGYRFCRSIHPGDGGWFCISCKHCTCNEHTDLNSKLSFVTQQRSETTAELSCGTNGQVTVCAGVHWKFLWRQNKTDTVIW